jgi:hypothetical protein
VRWQREWELISNRIGGLMEMAQLYSSGIAIRRERYQQGIRPDLPEVTAEIYKSARVAYGRIIEFRNKYDSLLPRPAFYLIADVINALFARIPINERDFEPTYDQTLAFVLSLAAFRSEFSLLLADTEAAARGLVDRAFLHLQRSLVADDSFAARWQRAFSRGETACEKLGAVHLLWFGIYAFKAASAGERTDLVLGDPVTTAEAERAADALVLTEWKKVSESDLKNKTEQAFNQARLYASGSLAGFELTSRRYLVMVSEKRLAMPTDRSDGAIVYEYRNIAVAPDPPSRGIREPET